MVWKHIVGTSVTLHDKSSLRVRLATLSPADKVDLLEHVYTWSNEVIEILDDAKVWNHAVDHNTGNHPDESEGEGDGWSSYARRDIKAGEELTDDYATFHKVPWFEALCVEHGAASCLQVGQDHR